MALLEEIILSTLMLIEDVILQGGVLGYLILHNYWMGTTGWCLVIKLRRIFILRRVYIHTPVSYPFPDCGMSYVSLTIKLPIVLSIVASH